MFTVRREAPREILKFIFLSISVLHNPQIQYKNYEHLISRTVASVSYCEVIIYDLFSCQMDIITFKIPVLLP